MVVTLTNSFVPTNGSSFAIATHLSRLGSFASTAFPALPSNLIWKVQYATNAILLNVLSPPALSGGNRLLDGSFQFSLSGAPAGAYDLQASTNLVDWTTIQTNNPFPGTVIITDTNAVHFERRFYRARIF